MAATTSTSSTAEAIAALPIPALGELTEQQVRGQVCVWDAVPLASVPAIDLGEQAARRAGQSVRWFPRACPACVGSQAYRLLLDHVSVCEQCVDDGSRCETGLGFNRLIREARR